MDRFLNWSSGAVVLAFLTFAGCEGVGCHRSSDCTSGLTCVGPNDPRGCGVPPRQQCAATSDCSGGEVCFAIYDSCSPQGVGSECRAKCSGSCEPGFRCNPAGACEPLPCDEGYKCPSHQRCDPAAAHASGPVFQLTQGCVNVTCTADSECAAAQSCVNGFCQQALGSCQKVYPVP